MKTYAEKLKDPRWQRKRLEIMQRDDFQCRVCGDERKTLHVHHIRYIKGREPWEYKDFYFVTLCEGCHRDEESDLKDKKPARAFTKSCVRCQTSLMPGDIGPEHTCGRLDIKTHKSRFDDIIESAPENADCDPATDEEMESFFGSLKQMMERPNNP